MKHTASWGLSVVVALGAGLGLGLWIGGASGGGSGRVCGITELAGGPGPRLGREDLPLLTGCPSGSHSAGLRFSLMASNGRLYRVDSYNNTAWSAEVPAGTYRAVGSPGCGNAGPAFEVSAGKTLLGQVVWWGCDYH